MKHLAIEDVAVVQDLDGHLPSSPLSLQNVPHLNHQHMHPAPVDDDHVACRTRQTVPKAPEPIFSIKMSSW
jgi:hypothetical protein